VKVGVGDRLRGGCCSGAQLFLKTLATVIHANTQASLTAVDSFRLARRWLWLIAVLEGR
jgi:hypothetical protein